jgi:anti-sigma B factor antagonist
VFSFDQVDRDDVLILTLVGRLDASTSKDLKAEIIKIADAGRLRVVVDLAQMTLVDSTGVGVLISLFKRTKAQNGLTCFAGLGGQPREVFKLLRLGTTLALADTVDDAVARVKGIK